MLNGPDPKQSDAKLEYPLLDAIPKPAELTAIADGVYWVRMPMPGRLNHINVWLFRDGDGWTIVDTGINSEDIRGHWKTIFDKYLEGRPVKRVICTHMHNDHAGLAGWLTRHWETELWMSRAEFFMCKVMASYRPQDVPHDAMNFYRRAGFPKQELDRYSERFGSFGMMISALPQGYRRLHDGERLEIGGRAWDVVVGRGHSAEHVCLYNEELKILISGDQVLPRITSNVSVMAHEPHANPLKEWLESCADLRERLPDDLLVMPAHQDPFRGLHERLSFLIEFHEGCLERLYALCDKPIRAVDAFPALFPNREIRDMMYFAATGESIAHLHYGVEQGVLKQDTDDDGIRWFERC